MKILLLHLSDAHFEDKTYIDENIINAQVQALNSVGDFGKCHIVFSGDIANSGQENQYRKAKFYLGKLWRKLTDKYNLNDPIHTFVVPGNHDIDFKGKPRNRNEVCDLLLDGITEEIINKEITNFNKFYDFAKKYNCFSISKLIDVKYYSYGNKKVQFNLVNSELFSTYNDIRGDDDKGKHYIPESELNKLKKGSDVDFVVTISHRGPEWFEWGSMNHFKKILYSYSDLFLYGHEHVNDINGIQKQDNSIIQSIAKGIDFPNKDINFTALIIDLDLHTVSTVLFA